MAVGAAAGYLPGRPVVWLINRIDPFRISEISLHDRHEILTRPLKKASDLHNALAGAGEEYFGNFPSVHVGGLAECDLAFGETAFDFPDRIFADF